MSFWELINARKVQKALFIGFGRGEEISKLSESIPESAIVYGIEVNHRLVDAAAQALSHLPQKPVLQIAKAEDLPFESETMDLVFCKVVLSEIPDWRLALAEMIRVTKQGGHVVIVDFVQYNPDWLTVSGDIHPGFDPEALIRELNSMGMWVLQREDAVGKGTIGILDGEKLWVETFFIEAIKEVENNKYKIGAGVSALGAI